MEMAVIRSNMGRLVVLASTVALIGGFGAGVMQLASMLGITYYTAKKVIDLLLVALDVWAIIGVIVTIIGTGGISIGLLYTAKALAKRFGARYAAMW